MLFKIQTKTEPCFCNNFEDVGTQMIRTSTKAKLSYLREKDKLEQSISFLYFIQLLNSFLVLIFKFETRHHYPNFLIFLNFLMLVLAYKQEGMFSNVFTLNT
ncbi:hypothetical protein BpHYR1_021093 [Brachionus plicatilis]|uniref:Uncharacterized protein n=1 Tax=Brachionus plicatilis TaxID=10195 RepID=A0A3M7SLJ3_BRAPC|nr:hypothetical protein BpHYR1_021093 [Brachionus plicatilis]